MREEKEEQRRQLDLLDQEVCTPSVCVGGGGGEGGERRGRWRCD